MGLLEAVQSAATERDLSSLSVAMRSLSTDYGNEQAQALVRSQILPQLSMKELLWLWFAITSKLNRYEMLSAMSEKTTLKLIRDGFVLGSDFSLSEKDGDIKLMLNAKAKNHLEATLTSGTLVTLQLLTRHSHLSRK